MSREHVVSDFYQILSEVPGFKLVSLTAPRIILTTGDPSNTMVMLHRHKEGPWWGLIGGKVDEDEMRIARNNNPDLNGMNLYGATLIREAREEAEISLSPQILQSRAELIAHTTVTLLGKDPIDPSTCVAKRVHTPLYLGHFEPREIPISAQNAIVPINGPMPGPLFPDASEGLRFVRYLYDAHAGTQIGQLPRPSRNINMRLGPEDGYYFQMEPMGLLMGPPPWLIQMKKMSGNVY